MDSDSVHAFARANHGLIDRATVLSAGGSDSLIGNRIERGIWTPVHPGVYQLGIAPLTWHGRLRAATLAAGPLAALSHRSAAELWGMEGVQFPGIELTVPNAHLPIPDGVIVHRTRRRLDVDFVAGIPVTTAERTILDNAWILNAAVIEQLYDSSIRKGLTTPRAMGECLEEFGTKGVKGRFKLLAILDDRKEGGLLGSPAETRILRGMRRHGIPEPERQFMVILPDGSVAILDFAWPPPLKAVEVDGLAAHSTGMQLQHDLTRQNLLFDVGWRLRRFTGRAVYQNLDAVIADIARFLAA